MNREGEKNFLDRDIGWGTDSIVMLFNISWCIIGNELGGGWDGERGRGLNKEGRITSQNGDIGVG